MYKLPRDLIKLCNVVIKDLFITPRNLTLIKSYISTVDIYVISLLARSSQVSLVSVFTLKFKGASLLASSFNPESFLHFEHFSFPWLPSKLLLCHFQRRDSKSFKVLVRRYLTFSSISSGEYLKNINKKDINISSNLNIPYLDWMILSLLCIQKFILNFPPVIM